MADFGYDVADYCDVAPIFGDLAGFDALLADVHARGLKLLLDAAHAFGCSHNRRPIGGFGSAEVFSFHATKFFNTFEGGVVTTNDDDLAARPEVQEARRKRPSH